MSRHRVIQEALSDGHSSSLSAVESKSCLGLFFTYWGLFEKKTSSTETPEVCLGSTERLF